MDKTIYPALKRIFAALLLLNTAVILIIVYLSFTNYSSQRKALIEMGYTVLRAFEASRPMVFTTGGNSHLSQLLAEMFDLDTIANIVIYRDDGQLIFSLHPDEDIAKLDIHNGYKEENKSEIILYNSFHLQSGMGSGMMGGGHMSGHGSGRLDSKILIAIAINKANLNSMKNTSLATLFAAILAELLIFFLYGRIKQVVKLYEQSSIRLKNAEKEASTGRLASVLAHEIKNPLSSMSGLLSFATKKCDNEQINDIIERTQEEVTRLSDIVNDFLTYGRTMDLQISEINIKPLIVKTTELMAHDAASKNILFNIQGTDFTYLGDENKFLQIFVNLFLNAIHASPAGSPVTINLDSGKNEVSITNSTIKPVGNDAEKFFEPFYTTKIKGSGLGLSITKRLVEQHGYNIVIASTNPFTVVLKFK